MQQLGRLAPFGAGNPVPLLLIENAAVDGLWPLGAEGRHTRVRLRQGETTLFVSLFGIPPQQLPYAPGDTVDALVEVSVFNGRSGPMVSAHAKAMRPAGLGNVPATQAAAFAALRAGGTLKREEAAAFLPDRSDTAKIYRMIRAGGLPANDLQPVFAALGPESTGRTLASLAALQELGLIENQNGRWMPAAVTAKRSLDDAPVLQKLRALAAQPQDV